MYVAWLCYPTNHPLDDKYEPVIKFVEPYEYEYYKVIKIVFSKVEEYVPDY